MTSLAASRPAGHAHAHVAPTRATGPVAGALRAGRFVGSVLEGFLTVELAHRRGGEEAARRAFADVARELGSLLGVRVHVRGKLEAHHEVRVANHTSYLDILAIASIDGGRFLSMHEVAAWPLVGRVARNIGTLFVDRASASGRAAALRALSTAVAQGAPLLVFPEGRTAKRRLLPFKRGAFSVARQAGVPVRPLALRWSDVEAAAWIDDMTLPPHLWARLCGPTLDVVVEVLPSVPTRGRTPLDVSHEVRGALARALELAEDAA